MEKLWTTAEVAQFLRISEADVSQLVREGTLTGYRLGGKFLRFRPDEVKALQASVTPQAPGAVATPSRPGWRERLRDFVYFYDFYILSGVLLVGVIVYLLASR